MSVLTPDQLRDLKAEKREIRKEMKERGIKRTSCFNGGLDGETYRLNSRLFAIETQLGR